MKIHPRTMVVQKADTEINRAINEIWKKYDLTNNEILMILTGSQQSLLKWALRRERHGDEDKGADEL